MFDIIIIGGGVVGTSIARELSRYKLKIALLEKEEELSFGVSKSNSGIIHPGTQNPHYSLKGRLCVQGNMLTRGIAQELGVDFKQVGELIVAFSQEEVPQLLRIKAEAESLRVPGLKIVDRFWLSKNEPNLSPDVVAALFAPTAGIISPYRMVYDLSENALRNGVEICTQACVKQINRGNSFEVLTSAGGFQSRYLINAAGLYADEISRMVGIDTFKITPRKGEEFILDKKRENLTNHLIFPLPTKTSKGVLMIKTSDGNPMIGPTAYDVEDKADLSTTDEGLEKVLSSVRRMIPSVSENDIIAYFSGLRPVAGDDFIIRHENKAPGFINVAGIQSPGLTSAPAIALLVSDILRKTGLKLQRKSVFHKHRIKTTHLFSSGLAKAGHIVAKEPSYGDIVCRCEMVSAQEVKEAIERGARTMDGIKFRTRAQAGRCHGSFCTTRIMKMLSESRQVPLTKLTKRGQGSELIKGDRSSD